MHGMKGRLNHKVFDMRQPHVERSVRFAESTGASIPILMAPMAGASPVSLAVAVANAGGVGACGAVLMHPVAIADWAQTFREQGHGPFQINLWVTGPDSDRDHRLEMQQREFLKRWGPAVPASAAETTKLDFEKQWRAVLDAKPTIISSIMGLFDAGRRQEMKDGGILWFATVTTVEEARAAEDAGADAIIAQGIEAGGHRGAFQASEAKTAGVGLIALLPQICDAVSVPVIAAGGIATARQIAAALMLGASAVQIGTGFLRTAESDIHSVYRERLATTGAHQTRLTEIFSGRAGRAIRNRFVEAAAAADVPQPAPYPIQRGLTRPLREAAAAANDVEGMQMWAGQSAIYAAEETAANLVARWWKETLENLV